MRLLNTVSLLCGLTAGVISAPSRAEILRNVPGWPVVFELNAGQTERVERTTPAGPVARGVKLISFEHAFEPDFHIAKNAARRTIREARVVVEVDGRREELLCRPYQSPTPVRGLLLYVETTREWAEAPEIEKVERVRGDVRFSAVAEGEAWGPSMTFPIRDYRWRASSYNNTWRSLVPYNLHYYHAGEDLGAIPDRLDVVAPWAGRVVASPLPGGDGKSNGIILQSDGGLEVRFAHMNTGSIDPAVVVGVAIRAGQRLGKTGMTWAGRKSQVNDPHLHTGFKIPLPDGTQTAVSPYPFFARAYFDAYPDPLLPIAGGYRFTLRDSDVRLDGSRSLARPGRSIAAFRWNLSDGRRVDAATATVRYASPGLYAEELVVRADDGTEDRDFAQVRVWTGDRAPEPVAYGWLHYTPVRGVRPGTEVTFWNRLARTVGDVTIDFGDGAGARVIKSEVRHAYANAGVYTVTLSGRGPGQEPCTVKTRVVVE
jgi:murein DD-endopeptidase MepM/ murein hydrolase activator NlpD